MQRDHTAVMAAFCEAYLARDLDQCATFFTDDVVYALYVDKQLAPFAGVSIGKSALMQRLAMVAQQFDLLSYRLIGTRLEGNMLRANIAYHFRHKATREDIAGPMRVVFQLRDGLFARVDEHHDRARVESFFRLISCTPPDR